MLDIPVLSNAPSTKSHPLVTLSSQEPSTLDTVFLLGDISLRKGEYPRSEKAFESVIESINKSNNNSNNNNTPTPTKQLSLSSHIIGSRNAMMTVYHKYILSLLSQQKYSQAFEVCEDLLSKTPTPSGTTPITDTVLLIYKADASLHLKNVSVALQSLKQALEILKVAHKQHESFNKKSTTATNNNNTDDRDNNNNNTNTRKRARLTNSSELKEVLSSSKSILVIIHCYIS